MVTITACSPLMARLSIWMSLCGLRPMVVRSLVSGYLLEHQAVHAEYQLRHLVLPVRTRSLEARRAAGRTSHARPDSLCLMRTRITETLSRPPLSLAICTKLRCASSRLAASACARSCRSPRPRPCRSGRPSRADRCRPAGRHSRGSPARPSDRRPARASPGSCSASAAPAPGVIMPLSICSCSSEWSRVIS